MKHWIFRLFSFLIVVIAMLWFSWFSVAMAMGLIWGAVYSFAPETILQPWSMSHAVTLMAGTFVWLGFWIPFVVWRRDQD